MRPVILLFTICLAIACASRVACQYEDSFEGSEGSAHDDEEDEGSQEGGDEGDETDDRDDEDFTTSLYGDDEKEGDDSSDETTTSSRVEEQGDNFLNHKTQTPETVNNNNGRQPGSPYIGYRGGYGPYIGPYFNQMPQRPSFAAPLPDNRLTHTNPFEATSGNAPTYNSAKAEERSREDNLEYLRKLRSMIIMARLRSHYGDEAFLPFTPSQSGTFKTVTPTPPSHNVSQTMSQEMETLRDRLRALELERVKLTTILIQFKGILGDMHEHATRLNAGLSKLNMSQRDIRVARLRNLFIILKAITKLTPLTSEELNAINYDVGLFDSKISDEGKSAMINRIAIIFRKKSHEDAEPNDANDRGSRFSLKNRLHSDSQPQPKKSVDSPKASTSQGTSSAESSSDEVRDHREILQCKLRRLRNLYLLVRPFVTGVKLTREELRELFQSREGFFEPSLTEAEKVAVVTKMADTIRMAYVSQHMIASTNSTSSVSSTKNAATVRPSVTQSTERPPTVPQVLRPPMFIFAQRLSNGLVKTGTNRPDKMHVSGKIQMDLNIDGDIGPEQEGLISKLL